jgi:anti-sigma-K factor RskA
MNIKEYLDCGVIEDYCLGVLTPEQMLEVSQNAAKYEEIRIAIEAYERVLIEYAEHLAGNKQIGTDKKY